MKSSAFISVLDIVKEFFDESKNKISIRYNTTIEVEGKDDETHLWIRTGQPTSDKITVSFGSVSLGQSIRGKGLFRQLVNRLMDSGVVDRIYVQTPLTEDMHKACRYLGLEYNPSLFQYKWVKANSAVYTCLF